VHLVFDVVRWLEEESLTSVQIVSLRSLWWLEQVAVMVIDALELDVIQIRHRLHQAERQPFKLKLLYKRLVTELRCLKVLGVMHQHQELPTHEVLDFFF